MQLTKYTDYSIRTLMYLALHSNREQLFRISEIKDIFNFSPNHVAKIIHNLGRLGYLSTLRGKNGGFTLRKHPSEINLGEIIRELENVLEPINCTSPYCQFNSCCHFKVILNKSVEAYFNVLDQYTLKDLITNENQLRGLLNKNN